MEVVTSNKRGHHDYVFIQVGTAERGRHSRNSYYEITSRDRVKAGIGGQQENYTPKIIQKKKTQTAYC